MKLFVVVEYKDVEVYSSYGDEKYVTETEMISIYNNPYDAKFEVKRRNAERLGDDYLYDVIEMELIG